MNGLSKIMVNLNRTVRVAVGGLILWPVGIMGQAPDPNPEQMISPSVIRYDDQLDGLIPIDAEVEILAEGFNWSEGPIWVSSGNYLIFSDVPENRIYRWSEDAGLSVWLEPSGYTGPTDRPGEKGSNGLTFDPTGRLVLAQHGDRRIARLTASLADPKPEFATVVDRWDGKRFNSPNDLVFDPDGNLYFTDPPYGLPNREDDETREIPFFGVYKLSANGALTVVDDEISRPNGVALSPDNKVLYVTDTATGQILAYELTEAGDATDRRVFADMSDTDRAGGADGLKVDIHGNVYSTGPGGVHVFAADGTELGLIDTVERCANLAWGDDGSALYITADMYLMRVKTNTTGSGL